MKYVIDASTAFPAYVAEPLSGKAIALRDGFLNGIHELLAPDFITTEMSNALIVAERRGRIARGDATRLFRDFLKQLPVLPPAWPDLLPRAHAHRRGDRRQRVRLPLRLPGGAREVRVYHGR